MCKFYEENFKTLLRDIKEDLSKLKGNLFFLATFYSKSYVKVFSLPEPIFKFKAIAIEVIIYRYFVFCFTF